MNNQVSPPSADTRLTADDLAIWSRFNDVPGVYGGSLRTMSREQDAADYAVMLDCGTNGQGLPLSGSVRNV